MKNFQIYLMNRKIFFKKKIIIKYNDENLILKILLFFIIFKDF